MKLAAMQCAALLRNSSVIFHCCPACLLTCCRYTGITSSEDGTIRVWDTWNVLQKTVIKPTQNRPGRKSMTTCNYSLDGRLIVGGLSDGTLQLWDVRGETMLIDATSIDGLPSQLGGREATVSCSCAMVKVRHQGLACCSAVHRGELFGGFLFFHRLQLPMAWLAGH